VAVPYLIQKDPNGSAVKQWDLRDKPLTVGRGDQVDAHIEDKEMSRQHFVISPKSNSYVLQDLKSRNGTLVNGQRISERALVPNDRIQAGQTNFVFVEGLATVIGKLENEPKGYRTYVRELSKDDKS
jgi:pSer/pThr/pTyr-binding forkhead associated (FHA) protein